MSNEEPGNQTSSDLPSITSGFTDTQAPELPPGVEAAMLIQARGSVTMVTADAPGDAKNYMVGQVLESEIVSTHPILRIWWTISEQGAEGNHAPAGPHAVYGSVLKAYPMSVNEGTPVPLSDTDLQSNPLTYVFTKPGDYIVTGNIVTESGLKQVLIPLAISAPEVVACTCDIGLPAVVRDVYNGMQVFLLSLRSQDNTEHAGLVITARVSANELVEGYLGFIQLLTCQRTRIDDMNQTWVSSLNGEAVLDNGADLSSYLYAGFTWSLQPNTSVEVSMNDSPGLELTSKPFPILSIGVPPMDPEGFQTFLFFKPKGSPNKEVIWVPLAVVGWYWGGDVEYSWETGMFRDPTSIIAFCTDCLSPGILPSWTANQEMDSWVLVDNTRSDEQGPSAVGGPPGVLPGAR